MKVLIIYPRFYIYGGGETLVVKLCNYLTKNGIENGILTTEIVDEIKADLINTKVHLYPVSKHKMPKKKHKFNKIFNPFYFASNMDYIDIYDIYKSLYDGLKEIESEYDVLNPHNFPADLVCLFSNKKKVWMCNEPEAYLSANEDRMPKKLKKLYKKAFNIEKYLSKFFMKNAVVADDMNAKRFKDLFHYSPNIVNYGVDWEYFSQKPDENPYKSEYKNNFIVLQSGMIQPYKNQLESIKTINALKDKIPDILLLLSGSHGDVEYNSRIDKYISENKLENYVKFLGHLDRSQIRQLYNCADVLLHPIHMQGGWLTPFECLSCANCPIVVSKEFPAQKILTENNIGTVTSDYADAIYDIYRNPDKYKEQAKRGGLFVENNLRWDNYFKKMTDLFKN